jgi:tripartite-type tricarboxylate transporter receptor subunit TctC
MRPLIAIAALASLSWAPPAAGAWPERPITLVVNSAAGGGADLLGRSLAETLSQSLGQRVVVENKPGAGGNIAAAQVARAAPDGYTLLLADSGMLAINPTLYPSIPFNPRTDFTPIGRIAAFAIVVAAHPSAGVRSIAELVERARAAPGTITYASTGVGSPQHLAAEILQSSTGIRLVHVPYRGGAPATADLAGGHVGLGFIGIPPLAPFIRDGRLVGLGVTGAARSPLLPDVPTVAETVPGFQAQVWFALMGPRGLAGDAENQLRSSLREGLASPDLRQALERQGFELFHGDAPELSAFLEAEINRWGDAVRRSGARAE